MQDWPILSLTTFVPLVGALFILFIRGEKQVVDRNARKGEKPSDHVPLMADFEI